MDRCEPLKEYSEFIGCIRSNLKTMDKGEAVDSAIDYCIGNGILKDFLTNNRNEVRSMSLFEFDAEEHEKVIKQIAYEEGELAGYDKGELDGAARGEQVGRIKMLYELGNTIPEISVKLNISEESVKDIIEA